MPARHVTRQQVFARTALEIGLLGETFRTKRSLVPLVSANCGIRCERLDQAHLALAARLPQFRPETLLRSLQERRTLIRTWGPKGLLQVVPAAEAPLYLAAAGLSAARWHRFLDTRSNLSSTARLRLLKRLCPHDISKDALRDAIPDATTRLFLLREIAQQGHIVWKEGDGHQAVFTWVKEWLGKKLEPEREFHGLVGRYLTTFGPVEAADLAGWLGVTVAAARKLMAKHRVVEVQVEGEPTVSFLKPADLEMLLQVRKSQARGWVVVPPGDPLLLAYKTRYHVEGEGDGRGLVFRDGHRVASWVISRDAVEVRFEETNAHQRVVSRIEEVLERAGIDLPIREETAARP